MKPSQCKSKVRRILSVVLSIAACGTVVHGILQMREYAYIYDLPADKLQQNLESFTTSSIDINMEDQMSSRQWGLTGACKLGTLSLASSEEYQVSVHTLLGKAKVALQPDAGEFILLGPEEESTLLLEAGSYDVYCVGKYFCGTVDVVPIIVETEKQ